MVTISIFGPMTGQTCDSWRYVFRGSLNWHGTKMGGWLISKDGSMVNESGRSTLEDNRLTRRWKFGRDSIGLLRESFLRRTQKIELFGLHLNQECSLVGLSWDRLQGKGSRQIGENYFGAHWVCLRWIVLYSWCWMIGSQLEIDCFVWTWCKSWGTYDHCVVKGKRIVSICF